MFGSKISFILLRIAAVLVGAAVPSMLLGRAVIGVCLGLALICVLFGADHKAIWRQLKQHLSNKFNYLILAACIGLAISLPFSVRVGLSFEAWIRTFALLYATIYVFFALQEEIPTILKSLAVSLGVVLIVAMTPVISLTKPVLNGILLIMPFCYYMVSKANTFIWKVTGFSVFILYVLNILSVTSASSSKASVAGLALMVLCAVVLFALTRLSVRKAVSLGFGLLVVLSIGLVYWLPNAMSSPTTLAYADIVTVPLWLVDLHRQVIWAFTVDMASQSPWVGYGLNASNYHPMAQATIGDYFGTKFEKLDSFNDIALIPGHPHNWILETLLDAGIFGLIPMLALVISIFVQTIKNYLQSSSQILLVLFAINVGYWGTGMLNFSFWSTWWQACYFVASALAIIIFLQSEKEAQI